MKVLHAAETVQGGVATVLRQLSESSKGVGLDFFLVAPSLQCTEIVDCKFDGVYLFKRTGRNVSSLFYFAICFLNALLKVKPDIVHLHSSFAGCIGRILLFFVYPVVRPKVIYMPHGWSFIMSCSKIKYLLYVFMERALLPLTRCIICVSDYERDAALAAGFPGFILRVVHNGVSCESSELVVELESPFPVDVFNILFVGRLDHQKGHDIAAAVIEKLPVDAYHLTVVGESVVTSTSDRFEGCITYAGWLSSKELVPYFKSADVLLMPSRWEAFGLVAVEAQSYSLPVLASNCCALPEVVVDGVTGYLFNVGDVDAIVSLILETKQPKWNEMGVNARQNYLDKFTADKMCSSIFGLYFSLDGAGA